MSSLCGIDQVNLTMIKSIFLYQVGVLDHVDFVNYLLEHDTNRVNFSQLMFIIHHVTVSHHTCSQRDSVVFEMNLND